MKLKKFIFPSTQDILDNQKHQERERDDLQCDLAKEWKYFSKTPNLEGDERSQGIAGRRRGCRREGPSAGKSMDLCTVGFYRWPGGGRTVDKSIPFPF